MHCGYLLELPQCYVFMEKQGCQGQGKKSGKRTFFQVREKLGNFGLSGKLEKTDKSQGKVGEFQNFLKTEMAMAVSLIFRNIN